jgi:molybdate/tungstate transport system ATP-binding protein
MLHLRALTKRYGSFALGPLHLDVGAEVVGVLGPSGSGKTTLLSLISGTESPDEGTVSLNGRPLDSRPLEARGTARVFQSSALFPHLTARQNIEYATSVPHRVDELAALLEIDDVLDQTARTLSGGENRRVEMARALASDPDALLLDEPTVGLDTPVRRRLRGHFRRLLTGLNIPVLYVTHNQTEASTVADRVAVLQDGELQQVGSPSEVFTRPATPFVAQFTGNPNVFSAHLASRHSAEATLEWHGPPLAVPPTDVPSGTDVWLCVRPEQVALRPVEAPVPSTNGIEAEVAECIFEGDAYVVTLQVGDDASASLQAKVLPATARALDLQSGRRVRGYLAPEALHLIPR